MAQALNSSTQEVDLCEFEAILSTKKAPGQPELLYKEILSKNTNNNNNNNNSQGGKVWAYRVTLFLKRYKQKPIYSRWETNGRPK